MNRIDKLKEQQKTLAARIKREQKRAHEKQRERIFSLAAAAGIANLPDAIIQAAFNRIAAEQTQPKTEVSDE